MIQSLRSKEIFIGKVGTLSILYHVTSFVGLTRELTNSDSGTNATQLVHPIKKVRMGVS